MQYIKKLCKERLAEVCVSSQVEMACPTMSRDDTQTTLPTLPVLAILSSKWWTNKKCVSMPTKFKDLLLGADCGECRAIRATIVNLIRAKTLEVVLSVLSCLSDCQPISTART